MSLKKSSFSKDDYPIYHLYVWEKIVFMTIQDFTKTLKHTLQPLYDEHEAAAIVKIYLQTKLSIPAYELALIGKQSLTDEQLHDFQKDASVLSAGKPLQYVLKETSFYGNTFHVSPSVLIPRQETEELVDKIAHDYAHTTPHIWDIGTGSGCIAISLAKSLPAAKVFASDISQEALDVARKNATDLGAAVSFAQHDMCDWEHLPFPTEKFDLIVSNPPYIPETMRAQLHINVREHEPATALFVPDERPLIFYEAIAQIGKQCLQPSGKIYLETFEDYHSELSSLFLQEGYSETLSLNDLYGRKRFLIVQKSRS